jgi:hypothetical protein
MGAVIAGCNEMNGFFCTENYFLYVLGCCSAFYYGIVLKMGMDESEIQRSESRFS